MEQHVCYELLNEQLKDISKAQIRSMSLAVLPRLIGALHTRQHSCRNCKNFSHEGETFVNNIRPLFGGDLTVQRKFEAWVNNAQHHLLHSHEQRVKGRMTSTFTTMGMLIGVIIGISYTWLSGSENFIGMAGLGWTIGMLVGYLSGKLKERNLSKNNKLY